VKILHAAIIGGWIATTFFSVGVIFSTFVLLHRIKVVSHAQVRDLVDKVSTTQLQELYLEQDTALHGIINAIHTLLNAWLVATVLNVCFVIAYLLLKRRGQALKHPSVTVT
jgi:hypothetical protein